MPNTRNFRLPMAARTHQEHTMNSSNIIYALRWLVRDTFRQALASKVFWIMLAISGLATVFCLGVSIEGGERLRDEGELVSPKTKQPLTGPNPEPGSMKLLFGAFKVQLFRDGESEIHMIQVFLGTWVAGVVGLLLTLVWTAGFLPDFLQPSAASVLLAKPAPRWLFLAGKFLGVVLFVAAQSLVFFGATWLALGIKTNVWLAGYLAGCPLLVLHFAALYSFSVLIAVCTRSTVACVLAVIVFWATCFGMNYARHSMVALPTLSPNANHISGFSSSLSELGYWVLPKPADFLMILEDALHADKHRATLGSLPEFETVRRMGAFDPVAALVTSFLFSIAMLLLAGMQLKKTDY